ncbi:MAG: helicase-related protein, partial [Adlercreutzia sp.]|nr:helicase-related protein [Adlercreutzia sp.]
EARILQNSTFSEYRVELLHGGMGTEAKQDVMERFRAGEIDVLVATTVIEVGVDVPNATVMIVEDADRFGLAQLHQLRGRVGRGEKSAEVYLVSASKRDESMARLAAMETTDDGFELAAYDLSLRREGDILGNRQHGASGLKLVNIMRDGAVIEAAHKDAQAILDLDPNLEEPDHRALAREVRLAFKNESTIAGG